ncbi:unnamed protein product [Camellia sinensis]
MLRNRYRAVTRKQALTADQSSLASLPPNHTIPISSFFGSPRFFNGFQAMGHSETETMSPIPNSISDIKPFSPVGNQFPKNFSGNKHSWENLNPKGIGLAIVHSLDDDMTERKFSQPNNRMVLFGSKLKIQIPQLPTSAFSPSESPKSPADFGIKTRTSQFICSSSPFGSVNSGNQREDSAQAFPDFLSASDMELSEDYTCVISHGPNPKTTHIYDNCIVESCCGVVGLSELKKNCSSYVKSNSPSESFLSLCYTCRKNLEQGKDIYMYRVRRPFAAMNAAAKKCFLMEWRIRNWIDAFLKRTCS